MPGDLPDWVLEMIRRGVPRAGRLPDVPLCRVGCLDDARAAVVEAAAGVVPVSSPPGRVEGDALAVAGDLCRRLMQSGEGLWVLGGETTVVLPERAGRGGRNQHLALGAAHGIAGCGDLLVLAAGTDGSDGNTADAGALVDGGSIRRGEEAGLDAGRCLATADSGRFLEASGDLVHTGGTGTNVGDLILGLRWEPDHSLGRDPSM